MIDGDGEAGDDEAQHGEEIERDGALGEPRTAFMPADLVASRGAAVASASFRTRSTTRARRTSAVAMSEPDARISKAGVIIAVIIACAGEMPPMAQPPSVS
jgi:hypothetical protein